MQYPTEDFFVDIHVHSTLKSFLLKELDSPWTAYSKATEIERLNRSMRVTRSDFTRLLEAGVRTICLSLHTLERYTLSKLITSPSIMSQLLKMDIQRLRQIVTCQPFKILQDELRFLQAGLKDPETDREAIIVRDYAHLTETLENPNKLAIVLTIEGAHNLGFEYQDQAFPRYGNRVNFTNTILESAEEMNEALVDARVAFMKDHHVFFLTLNHFVFNHLATMPKAAELTGLKKRVIHNPIRSLAQVGAYRGLTFLGYYFVERCFEHGILLDLKHCDAVTRRQIYTIAERYGKPVLGSHIAVSGKPTNVAHYRLKKLREDSYEDRLRAERFNPWDINFHDDDIIAIHRLGGLLGLINDIRVLGSVRAVEIARKTGNWLQLLYNQIEHVYRTLVQAGFPPETCFDSLCIGSDFDGFIEPMQNVPTVEEYRFNPERDAPGTLRLDNGLVEILEQNRYTFRDSGLSPTEIRDRILRTNAMRFFQQHFQPVKTAELVSR